MKNIAVSLLMALTLSTPALAANPARFERMDLDKDGFVTLDEANTVCKVKPSIFKYADENSDGKLSSKELRSHFSLFQRC